MSETAILLMVSLLLLKITGVVAMSWWWVLCPIWAPVAAVFVVFIGLGILCLIGFAFTMLVIGVMMLIEKVTA